MCGIVGYVGKKQAAPILLDGLAKLEYRGYDSAGLAVRDGDALAEVVKEKGKLKELSDKVDGGRALKGITQSPFAGRFAPPIISMAGKPPSLTIL